ncbi:hypothetical protein NEOLEDRAFT_1146346 [Neolentinus lepideus HHB14362 ss-1]|uniref:Uncharacterized protein n=1 Tax=Neolentinus lepideus HHB14362 ss-1 TaxID=1314782 RepID=A0A165U1A0_9AGAM|nr:hypothetical protein NEOLEDRAFT_1146346 [Neolentinus lepideus HHB14362 ss-1]
MPISGGRASESQVVRSRVKIACTLNCHSGSTNVKPLYHSLLRVAIETLYERNADSFHVTLLEAQDPSTYWQFYLFEGDEVETARARCYMKELQILSVLLCGKLKTVCATRICLLSSAVSNSTYLFLLEEGDEQCLSAVLRISQNETLSRKRLNTTV